MTDLDHGSVSVGSSRASSRRELEEWSAFFVRHTQRLEQCHNVLFGLAWLDGPPSMHRKCEERLASGKRVRPWIRATSQWVPPGDEETSEQIEVVASLGFSTVPACALAPVPAVGLVIGGLGSVRRMDLRRGRDIEPDVTVRRERPLQIACSEDGRYIAIAFESGRVDVLELEPEVEGAQPERPLWSGRYRLPAYEEPILEFVDSELWLQAESDEAVAYDAATGADRRHISPPRDLTGPELAGVIRSTRDATILAWRGDGGSRIVCVPHFAGEQTSVVAEAADVSAINRWGNDFIAVSFSNNRLCIYATHPALELRHQLPLDAPVARLAECGSRLCWLSTDGRMHMWTSIGETPQPVLTPGLTLVGPRGLAFATNGDGFALTRNIGVAFRLAVGATRGVVIQTATPKDGSYVALAVKSGSYVVINGARFETIPLTPGQPRTTGARADGREVGYLFAADGEGKILISQPGASELVNPSTGDRLACDLPDGTISATARQGGGFWLADQQGRIFCLDRQGAWREAAQASRDVLGPPRLAAWGSLVVWTGTRVSTRARLGADPVYLQVFFRSEDDRLQRIGEREYAATKGVLQTVSWDESEGRLINLWQGSVRGSTLAGIGSPELLIAGEENETLLPDIFGICVAAAIIPGSRRFLVLSEDGAIRWFDADTLAPVASLAGSLPFTSLSENASSQNEVVAIAGRQRVLCLRCEVGGSQWISNS